MVRGPVQLEFTFAPSMSGSGKETSRVKNVVDKSCDTQDSVAPAVHSVSGWQVGMAEVVAVTIVLEVVLAVREALNNVKTNVRVPAKALSVNSVNLTPAAPALPVQRNKCAHLAQRLATLEPVLRRGQVRGGCT